MLPPELSGGARDLHQGVRNKRPHVRAVSLPYALGPFKHPQTGTTKAMPNLASVLKAEVARLARKELRDATDGLKKSVAAQRTEIAALKRRVQDFEKQLKAQTRAAANGRPATSPGAQAEAAGGGDAAAGELRFRAAGMANNRKRLGLSAEDFGLLVGATGQSIYAWEGGKAKPRTKNLAAIAALRGLGKREVNARLAALKQSA